MTCQCCGQSTNRIAELDRMLAKAQSDQAAALRDAERYRWLRLQPFDRVRDMFALFGNEEHRDTAIDTAINIARDCYYE